MTTNYREILRLKSLGLNKTDIASAAQCARNTVSATLERAKACGLEWPLPEGMNDKELAEKLFPSAVGKTVFKMPDYAHVHHEMQRHGVTLTLLWLEYCDQCKAEGAVPYQSTQFNKYYNDYLNRINATMHLNHKPGEIMQVDWAGDTAAVVDTDTGEIIPAFIFVATLPFSAYSYVEAFLSMDQEAWITAHVNALNYFGGVPRMIQCDNLKTGVEKHGRHEIVLNRTYQELAEHYETAIIPARVRAPKDKAAVEGTVGIISTYILAALRNRQFLSLQELNEAVWDRLESFNHKPFQKREGSRSAAFSEEKLFLRPLPVHPYELATWKVATVGPNYHIAVDRMNYSVPFEYIRQKVDVRITRSTIEVFYKAYGHDPERVLADTIFRTRENMKYCKQHGIHLNGPKLGKPYADPAVQKQQKKLEWQESGERGEIERSFGVGKRRYGLDCIVTKLKETSEVMIHASVLYMNLRKKLRLLLRLFFSWLWNAIQNQLKAPFTALA